MESLVWSDNSEEANGSSENELPRGELLFQIFTEPLTQSQLRHNNIWSNRHYPRSVQTLPMRNIVNYADTAETTETAGTEPSTIRRVIRSANSNNFQIQCLNLDDYLNNMRNSNWISQFRHKDAKHSHNFFIYLFHYRFHYHGNCKYLLFFEEFDYCA